MKRASRKVTEATYEFPNLEPHSRLWELILHIARCSEGDPTFGKVKLAKILYYADFASYRDYGQAITGASYKKLQFGPVPKDFLDILDEMENGREIYIRKEKAFPPALHDYDRVMAIREANLVQFSGRDIALVDRLIRQFWNKSATEISDQSHGIAWQAVENNELIPYSAALLSDEGITDEDVERAQALIQTYGWDV